jgi:hypothetical protein
MGIGVETDPADAFGNREARITDRSREAAGL